MMKLMMNSSLLNYPLFSFNNQSWVTHSIKVLSVRKSSSVDKRPIKRKKKSDENLSPRSGFYRIAAYSTAEEYNLDEIHSKFKKNDVFRIASLHKDFKSSEFIHATINPETSKSETSDIFIFQEGAVVTWNVTDLDVEVLLSILARHQSGSHIEEIVREECEIMNYSYSQNECKTEIIDDDIVLGSVDSPTHDKYAVSNAMALSVKLGTWEAILQRYIDSMEDITDDLKCGNRIKMSQAEVMKKTGELFALRHAINLSSDLLDTPDVYWDREELEKVYHETLTYFSINKRTRVINEKINHCIELVELLSSHLRDNHHVRLEWMIIILIMVEVAFEALRHIEDKSG